MARLEGRIALVTGASRGLGRAIAIAFAQEGAFVYIHYRRREKEARKTLEEIEECGGEGSIIDFDLADPGAIKRSFLQVVEEKSRIDILVNNAGVCRDNFFVMMEPDEWNEVISVNLSGAYHCCHAVVRPMIAQGGGVILQVASVSGLHASAGQANYAASKGGLLSMTRTLAAELAPKGIRVNSIVPGLINTGMTVRMNQRIAKEKMATLPLKRFGEKEEVAKVAVFLASDDASYIVGQAICVDGGLTL